MRLSPCIITLGAALQTMVSSANNENTRNMYTIRPPKVNRERRAVEIIDLGNFLLTNSEDGRPKSMAPFYLNIFETREDLSEEAIRNVEEATSEFLLTELNAVVDWDYDYVADVSTKILRQERFVKQVDERNLKEGENSNGVRRGRQLRNVPGSKLEMNVNVTFDREPSPDVSEVDDALQFVMKDLVYLVHNITATEDPELGYVFMAYREEISEVNENPTKDADEVQTPITQTKDRKNPMQLIVPILIFFVLLGAFIALFVIRRKRRRVQAANQKVQEDLAFLDEETNVFSFENSPTKSSARKRAYEVEAGNYDADNDSCSRYSTSQGSVSVTSPNYGNMISGIGSPTARSSMSGASTVKVSNARLMPLPSKLTELASTSLFAFSEEDEDFETSTEGGNSQRTPTSLQQSEASIASSAFNRIMNGDEGVSSVNTSPRQSVASPTGSASLTDASAGQQDSSNKSTYSSGKSTFSSLFSSHFFGGGGDSVSQFNGSTLTVPAANTTEAVRKKAAKHGGGDNVSQFNGSTLTVQAANTTEAVRQKAAKYNVRSFSLSPRHNKKDSPSASVQSRAKSDTGADDDSADSVFDFVATSPKKTQQETTTNKASKETELTEVPLTPMQKASPGTSSKTSAKRSTPSGSAGGTPTQTMTSTTSSTPTTTSAASPSHSNSAAETSVAAESEASTGVATPGTVQSHSSSYKATPGAIATKVAADSSEKNNSALEALRNLKKVVMTPRTPVQSQSLSYNLKSRAQAGYDEDMSEEDSLSEGEAPGSFPRRSRRHAKSTTHDGTFAYQTNAMQPQEWSMTDGYSDDDTLSEHGAGAAFGAFPKAPFISPAAQRKLNEKSPSNMSKSSYSQVTQNSPGSKAESSQASASRQLINDLVWLSKKIAGVKQSAVESAPAETSALGAPPQIEPVDSLSYASQDGLISPTSAAGTRQRRTPGQGTPTQAGASANTSIVCRDCHAPPGKLNIVIHSTKDGPAVHEVKRGSCLEGRIYPGDLIIAVDDIDTRAFTAAQLMKMMAERGQSERKITVLHFEEADTIEPPCKVMKEE